MRLRIDAREYGYWMAYYHMISDPNYGRVEPTGDQVINMFAAMPGVIDNRKKAE